MKTLKQILDESQHSWYLFDRNEILILVRKWLQQKFNNATPHTKEREIISELLEELERK